MNIVNANNKLDTIQLNETNISNSEFDENLLVSKNINNNIKMNIQYDKEGNLSGRYKVFFLINGKYYTSNQLRNRREIECIINDNIIQNKLLTVFGKYDYETDIPLYKWYEFFSNDTNDYLIVNEIFTQTNIYGIESESYDYKYIESYKCLRGNKTDEERFEEYLNAHYESYLLYEREKTIEKINNEYTESVIIYTFGNTHFFEIIPKDSEYTILARVLTFSDVPNRTIE